MTSRDVRNTLTRDAAVSRYITLAITLAITLETLGITTLPPHLVNLARAGSLNTFATGYPGAGGHPLHRPRTHLSTTVLPATALNAQATHARAAQLCRANHLALSHPFSRRTTLCAFRCSSRPPSDSRWESPFHSSSTSPCGKRTSRDSSGSSSSTSPHKH